MNHFLNNADKPIYRWSHYFDIYERHFNRFRNKAPLVLEIGVAKGGSLAMWKDYFGADSRVVGIDIDPDCRAHAGPGIDVRIGSQDDERFLRELVVEFGAPDVVIDDGSHMMSHVTKTFSILYPLVDPNGVYLVEDMHTAYLPEYEGGVGRSGTFIELCKGLIDQLNALYTNGDVPVTEITRGTDSITFYDSVVVLEKRPQARRQAITTGPMPVF
jgi:hypothetical protein